MTAPQIVTATRHAYGLVQTWTRDRGVDGRFLSSEVCESFTGRALGPYARDGVVDVLAWDYAGQDIQR